MGSKLALEFLSLGYNVSLLLRPESQLDRISGHQAEFTIGRATSMSDIQEFVFKAAPDVIVHTACSYGRRGESLLEMSDANYRFGLSIAQFGLAMDRPLTFINTSTGLDPQVNFYALTKHQFSQTGQLLASRSGSKLRFINVLLEHMYGPGDHKSKFTTHVLEACRQNIPEINLTMGTQKRDFIYIDDVVSAYVAIIKKAEHFGSSADIEVGSGIAPSVREFVETAHRLTGSSSKLNFGAVPFRPQEAMHCQANIAQMKSLGWMPKYDLVSGINKTIQMGD